MPSPKLAHWSLLLLLGLWPSSGLGAPPPAAGLKLTLLKPGAAPRKKLRLELKQGNRQIMKLDLRMEISMEMQGSVVPPMRAPATVMELELTVVAVKPNGDARFEFVVRSAEVSDPGELTGAPLEQTKTALQKFVGVNGWTVVSAAGRLVDADLRLPENVDSNVMQMMDGLRRAVTQVSAPLPDQAVGVGAQWKVGVRVDQLDIPIQQDTTHTLKVVDGNQIEIETRVTQIAKAKPIQMPGLPPGVTAKLLGLESTGSGSIKQDLHRVGPSSSKSEIDSVMKNEVTARGVVQQTTMHSKAWVEIRCSDP